jgi:hypothetical protein
MKHLISARFLLCLLAAFILFAIACYFFPRSIIGYAVPFLTYPISVFHPDYTTQTSLDGGNALVLDAIILETQRQGNTQQSSRRKVRIRHEIGSLFGIPIVFYPLIFSWPATPFRYRYKSALLVLPIMLLLIAVDISLTLLLEIEARLVEPTLWDRIMLYLAQGLNGGGRQFLGLLLFAAAIAPRYLKKPIYAAGRSLERNNPCPCGSGKKYKNCCMR